MSERIRLKDPKFVGDVLVPILARHPRSPEGYAVALLEIARALGRDRIGESTVRFWLARYGFPRAQELLGTAREKKARSVLHEAPEPRDGRDDTEPSVGVFPRPRDRASMRGATAGFPRFPVDGGEHVPRPKDLSDPIHDSPDVDPMASRDPQVRRLIDATKGGKAVGINDLCDRLDLAPKKLKALIDRARAAGVAVEVAHDHVALKPPEPTGNVQETGIAPGAGRQTVAIISDTHLGSKYCLRQQLRDFVEHAYEKRGVREVLHVGDALDGSYRHGMFELTHAGIEDQTRDLFEVLPRKPGLTYHGISGNHDDTFADDVGMSPGDYMSWYFRQHGRNDLRFYGRRGAYLKVRGAIVELWHPRKSGSYALSYHLQNHIRDYGVGQKPDILLAGHWHTFVYLEQRGVHAIACGTFQGSGSAFSKSLGGSPSIGGTIVSWELTKDRTLRSVVVERCSYYERESPRDLDMG